MQRLEWIENKQPGPGDPVLTLKYGDRDMAAIFRKTSVHELYTYDFMGTVIYHGQSKDVESLCDTAFEEFFHVIELGDIEKLLNIKPADEIRKADLLTYHKVLCDTWAQAWRLIQTLRMFNRQIYYQSASDNHYIRLLWTQED